MRKIIVAVRNCRQAESLIARAKKTPGVRYTQKYMAGSHYHVMICGEFSDEDEKSLVGRHRNQAGKPLVK